MTNQQNLRPLLLICLASLAVSIVLAIVTGAFSRDEPESVSQDARNIPPQSPPQSVAARQPQTYSGRRDFLEEYSVDIVNQNNQRIGTVRVHSTSRGVAFNIFARKLWPGPHVINLHEHGVCEGPDFVSAGGHFNPTNATHGVPDHDTDPNEQDHHIGDMRGDRANDQGQLNHRATNASVTLGPTLGGVFSIADEDGTSLVIAYGADSGPTDSFDEEHPRVACAVITEPFREP